MTIGDVFAGAWSLWRRDVGWLILAGLVVGVIMAVVFGIAFGIFTAIFAGAGLSLGVDAANNTTSSLSGLGAGLLVVGFVAYIVVMFFVEVLAMTFYGGMFEMVIGSYRDKRPVSFGDLFSGFRKFGSYAVFALVMLGISLGLNLLGLLPFLGGIIAFVISVWLSVIWMYVLPLIADQGLGFSAAAGRSNQMVKAAGWWWTFGMVVLLGLAALAAVAVILIVARVLYGGSEGAGIVLGLLLFLLLAVLFPPYAICYVSVLYVASGGDVVPATAGGLPGIPPAPPAPSTYGAPAPPAYGAPAPPRTARRPPPVRLQESTAVPSLRRIRVATTPGRRLRTRWRIRRRLRSRRPLRDHRPPSRRPAPSLSRRPSPTWGRRRRPRLPSRRRRPTSGPEAGSSAAHRGECGSLDARTPCRWRDSAFASGGAPGPSAAGPFAPPAAQ